MERWLTPFRGETKAPRNFPHYLEVSNGIRNLCLAQYDPCTQVSEIGFKPGTFCSSRRCCSIISYPTRQRSSYRVLELLCKALAEGTTADGWSSRMQIPREVNTALDSRRLNKPSMDWCGRRRSAYNYLLYRFQKSWFIFPERIGPIGKRMKAKILVLLWVALIAAVSPAVIFLAAGASPAAAHSHHPTGPPGTVPPCDFDHPTSLPPQASPNATAALSARASHCPTTTRA